MLHNSLYEANLLHPNSNIPSPKMSRALTQVPVDSAAPVGDAVWEGRFPLVLLGIMEPDRQKNRATASKQADKQNLPWFWSGVIGPFRIMMNNDVVDTSSFLDWFFVALGWAR